LGISQKQASGESANARGRELGASCACLNFGASPLPWILYSCTG